MERIAIVCPNMLPVPAVKGGAIETLIEHIINENENEKLLDITIFSIYDEKALSISKKYKYSKFIYNKINRRFFNINIYLMRVIRKIFKIDIPVLYYSKILKEIKKSKYKKILVQADIECANYLNMRLKEDNIYLHIHSCDFETYSQKINNKISKLKKVICVSQFIINQAKKVGYYTKNMEVLRNCVDNKVFDKKLYSNYKQELMKRYNINNDDIVILFTGRLIEIKGVKELIIAFRKLQLKYKCKLLIVGNSGFANTIVNEYDKELYDLTKGIENKVIFGGFIHNKDLPKIHSICDIAVVPSIGYEAAGLVVLEAMSSGIPLIVTNSGGIPEYIDKKYIINLDINEDLIDNLYKSMEYLIKNPKKRLINAENSKIYVDKYNVNTYYNNFLEIIL